jgi:hypothetical protein
MRNFIAGLILLNLSPLTAYEQKLEIRHLDKEGVGNDTGYTTADFYHYQQWERQVMVLNARSHFFNDKQSAVNLGIGYRQGFNNSRYLFGANAFYDFRSSKDLLANQIGMGVEFLSRYIDIRFNGYFPTGKQKDFETKDFRSFEKNNIFIKHILVGSLPSTNFEISFTPNSSFNIAGGRYYLFRQAVKNINLGDCWGTKFRACLNIGPYFTFGTEISHDKIFKTRTQASIGIKIALGPHRPCKPTRRDIYTSPIIRNEIIPFEKKERIESLKTDHDRTLTAHFVNNTAPSGGDGSFQSPFSSLKEAEANSNSGDIIYVFPGDGTSRNMQEGIILKENQILASTGETLEIDHVVIPPLTPGQNPIITNIHTNEPIVSNVGHSTLKGFKLVRPREGSYLEGWDFDYDIYASNVDFSDIEGAGFDVISSTDSIDAGFNNQDAAGYDADHASSGLSLDSSQEHFTIDGNHDWVDNSMLYDNNGDGPDDALDFDLVGDDP